MGSPFGNLVNQMVIEFGDVSMKVDLEFWLIKWLLDFGNVIMKVESLELKWF